VKKAISKHEISAVLRRLAKPYEAQNDETMLESLASQRHETPFQILIAAMLSARTRDEVTSEVSDSLFAVYPTPEKLSNATLSRIKALIKPINFYKGKAKRVREVAKIIHEQYDDKVPKTMKELDALPGVGPKIAGCVLVYAFKISALPIDTHCHRLANRLKWVKTKTPEQTMTELEKTIPKRYWLQVNELLVLHGQRTCLPRNPRCCECVISGYCPSNNC